MLNQYLQELEQDVFDGEEFVERLAWRVQTNSTLQNKSTTFDPDLLYSAFNDAISDLRLLDQSLASKCKKLENYVKEEESQHWHRIAVLLDQNRDTFKNFQELDSHINSVATKVVHLGDQLENVNTPRARAVEAQKLMNHFAEFLSEGPLVSEVFTDKSRIYEAADIIQKLFLIAQELPSGKFESAKKKIVDKYNVIECSLIQEFVQAHISGDVDRMKQIASTLSHFKGYNQCVNVFIEEAQIGSLRSRDIFGEVVPLCLKSSSLIREVFTNHEQVMAKFVIRIFQEQLKDHIHAKLEYKNSPDLYLRNLHDLYSQTNKLCIDLQIVNLGTDSQFLPKLTKQIFHQHLSSYISIETRFLKEKFRTVLSRFYESIGHQKKNIQSGAITEIRERIQDVIQSKANINIGISSENCENLLSEETAISLMQETKHAFKRCQILSNQSEMSSNAVEIFALLSKSLLSDHVDYAIELGSQSIPGGELRMPPDLFFFQIVQQCSSVFNLFDKLFNDHLVPLVISTPKHGDCLQKKKSLMQTLEQKLDYGLDRTLNSVCNYIKFVLNSEQKKSDFKPESDILMANATLACQRVVQWTSKATQSIRNSLDGNNLECVFMEFGIRFHRVIQDHLFKYEYNSIGAMAVICDVNEYRKCALTLKQPFVNTLFDTLHTLCKLLQVSPENLKVVCSGDELACLDKSVLVNFIQLRSDYKSEKLQMRI